MQELLEKVKLDLKIKHTSLDDDVKDQISACLQDLQATAGIKTSDTTDPLIIQAVKLYCRAWYKTEQMEIYQNRYDTLKASLQMATGYGRDNAQN